MIVIMYLGLEAHRVSSLRPASLAMSLAPRSCRVLVLMIVVVAFWTRDGGAAVEYH
jgi:hypothetical protein